MLDNQEIIMQIMAIKRVLPAQYPIRHLALFGSVARNEAGPDSDIDILIEFGKPIGNQFLAWQTI